MSGEPKKEKFNFDSYSQMSKMEWTIYRQGVMKHSRTDYSNFSETFEPEKDEELNYKEKEQWNRAYQRLKASDIEEENKFRKAVF